MKISIITPNFNQGRFIRDCIESVRTQTGVEWEHIIMDAASTDGTVSILKEYPHLKWVSEKDKGMCDGINKGFLRAEGDLVMWLNADDYLLPGALEKVAAFAEKNPDADVIYGECIFVTESKEPIRRKREHNFDFQILLFYGCYIPSTSTFLRRKIITDGELLDLSYRVVMDFEYYVRLSERGYRFKFLPEALACFRWHASNTSTSDSKARYRERLRVQQEYLRRHGKNFMANEKVIWSLWKFYKIKRLVLRFLSRYFRR
jgi:glycosyltransferase involved in cell wall biosynthesis